MKKCPACGAELIDSAKFCKICGYQFPEENIKINERPKTGKKAPYLLLFVILLAVLCYLTQFHKTVGVWLRAFRKLPDDEKAEEIYDAQFAELADNGQFWKDETGRFRFTKDGRIYEMFVIEDLNYDGRDELLISGTDDTGMYFIDVYKHDDNNASFCFTQKFESDGSDLLSQKAEAYDNGVLCIRQSDKITGYLNVSGRFDSTVLKKQFSDDIYCMSALQTDNGEYVIYANNAMNDPKTLSAEEYEKMQKELFRSNQVSITPKEWTAENIHYVIKSAVALDNWLSGHGVTITPQPGNYHIPIDVAGESLNDFWGRYYLDGYISIRQTVNDDGTKNVGFYVTVNDYPYSAYFNRYSVFDRYTGTAFECNADDASEGTPLACNVEFELDGRTINAVATYYDMYATETGEEMLIMEAVVPEDYEGTVFQTGVEFDPEDENYEHADFSQGPLRIDEISNLDGRYLYFTLSNN